jgi:hypothetical protein
MAMKGLSFAEEETYICRDDPGRIMIKGAKGLPTDEIDVEASLNAGATGFIIQNISSGIMARIQDMNQYQEQEYGSNKFRVVGQLAQKNREAFKWGIREFINFPDRKGKPIEAQMEIVWEGGRQLQHLKEEVLDRVPGAILSEVGAFIIKRNTMTDEQAKNFEALLSQLGASNTSSAPSATEETSNGEDTSLDGSKTDQTENP